MGATKDVCPSSRRESEFALLLHFYFVQVLSSLDDSHLLWEGTCTLLSSPF